MDINIAKFILSDRLLGVSSDELVVYLILRSDILTNYTDTARFLKAEGKLASGLGMQSVAQRLNIPDLTAKRLLDAVVRRCWVKEINSKDDILYQLGTLESMEPHWFIDEAIKEPEKEHEGVARIRKMLKEKKARSDAKKVADVILSPEAKKKIADEVFAGGLLRDEKAPTLLVRHFKDQFVKKYKIMPHLVDGDSAKDINVKAFVFAGRVLKWCKDDLESAKKVCEFVIDRWEMIGPLLKIEGRPSLAMIATRSVFERLMKWVVEGIPLERPKPKDATGLADRVDHKALEEAPLKGWE